MKRLQLTICFGLMAAMLGFGLQSCKKVEEPASFHPDRMFTPTDITATGGETEATITWRASLFASGPDVSYTLEISPNQDFSGTPTFTSVYNGLEAIVTDANLAVRTNYYARVKANATANAAASNNWVATTTTFQITGEQLFLPIDDNTLTAMSVVLAWKPTPDLTKIVLTPNGGTGTDHTLTATDLADAKKAFNGLTPSTQYTAEIFKGTTSKGTITFNTKSGPPAGTTTVVVTPTDDLAALIAAATPGTVFLLEQNTLYATDNAIVLPDGASFTVWGDHGPNKPVLAFNGITLPNNAGTIRFENVDVTGYQNNDPTAAKRNYIFNQSATTNTEAIIFENCIIRNFTNTPFRLQGSNSITINNLTVNRCISYDIGDNGSNGTYAFVHTNVATGKFNNIAITNSTLYKIGYSVILHSAAPSLSVTIENCTFDNVVGNGRFFVDYNAQTTGNFLINNVIIGKTLSPAGSARGIRAGSPYTVGNSFQASDAVFADNAVAGITSYAGTSTALFTDPANGNFLIKDNSFTGRSSSGDPRWRL